jgi:filamentous hemagglutinin family protein
LKGALCLSVGWLVLGQDFRAIAQSITPASDGVGTVVNQSGNRFDITGGTRAGSNLYQSFQQFGLDQNQIANFLSNPSIQTILGRVVGGDPSVIHGLIQVTGGSSNLFLMNPAGIVFGANASLNVPAAFTATTANGIQIGNQWFGTATSASALSTLTGTPNAFAFTTAQPGSIFNAGNLAVNQGQSITLIGGTVVNTGVLAAPGGTVTIAAIPGEKLVRLSPSGGVLSLDLPTEVKASVDGTMQPLTPLSFPALLVRSSLSSATGVTVENGTVTLTNSNTLVPTDPGTAIAAGQLDASSTQRGGTVQVLGDKVGLVGATLSATGNTGGGTVLVGGDYQGKGAVMNASRTFVSPDSVIRVDAETSGNGGRAIVWADDTTQFFGTISARGGAQAGDGGFVEVSGKQTLQYQGRVDTTAPNGATGTLLLDPADITITPGGTASGFTGQVLSGDAGPTTITQNQLQAIPGNTNIVIQASNTITIQKLGTLAFTPGRGAISFEAGGVFTMDAGDTINTAGRDISITAASLELGTVAAGFGGPGTVGGTINLTATNGGIVAEGVRSQPLDSLNIFNITTGDGGKINISATNGNISIFDVSTLAGGDTNNAADVTIRATNGSVTVSSVNTVAVGSGRAGNITIDATNGISSELLDARAVFFSPPLPSSGRITLNGQVQASSQLTSISGNGTSFTIGSDAPFIPTVPELYIDPVHYSVDPIGAYISAVAAYINWRADTAPPLKVPEEVLRRRRESTGGQP